MIEKILGPPQFAATSARLSISKSETKHTVYFNPLPDPDAAERYEALFPGTLERCLVMAEVEQKAAHKQAMEDLNYRAFVTKKAFFSDMLGMTVGSSVMLAMVIIGSVLLGNGIDIGGYTALAAGLGGYLVSILGSRLLSAKTKRP